MLLSLPGTSSRDGMLSGWLNRKVKCVSSATQLKTAKLQPTNITFLLSISVIVSPVPLPVCTGVDLCAVSHLL